MFRKGLPPTVSVVVKKEISKAMTKHKVFHPFTRCVAPSPANRRNSGIIVL